MVLVTVGHTQITKNLQMIVVNASVSSAIALGQPEMVSISIAIATCLLVYNLYLRKGKFVWLRYFLLTVIGILLILIVWINPFNPIERGSDFNKVDNEHGNLAISAFTINLFYNLFTYVLLYLTYRNTPTLLLTIFLFLAALASYAGLIAFQIATFEGLMNKETIKEHDAEFSILENLQILFFLITGTLIAFYHSGKTSNNENEKKFTSFEENDVQN